MNDGVNTRLYYATKTTDSTFNFIGELNGPNQSPPPHLDAVADIDSLNNFYWTSTRDYPAELDNLFHGSFSAGNVTSIGRVHGDFNRSTPGWLVMDHGISYDGQLLYYNNARFDDTTCQGPCETELGIAALDGTEVIEVDSSGELITAYVFADKYFEMYINGVAVGKNNVPFTQFNSNVTNGRAAATPQT